MKGHWIGWLLAASSVTAFATTFVCGSSLTKTDGVSPAVLACLRFVVACALQAPFVLGSARGRQRYLLAPTRRDWILFATLGPVGTSLMAWCVFEGCARVSTANASMADALAPLFIFFAGFALSRRIGPWQVVGCVTGFVGALLVVGVINGDGVALDAYSTGDVFILLAALTWAFYSVLGRKAIKRLGADVFSFWTMASGAFTMGLVLPFGSFSWPAAAQAWGQVALLSTVCTLFAFWAWNAAQRHLSVTSLAMSAYFTPVAALVLAFLALGEKPTALQLLGVTLVAASAVVELDRK